MRIRMVGIGIVLLIYSTPLFAQQGLLGTYKAWYRTGDIGHKILNSATLEITSTENGKIAGKLNITGDCNGNYVLDGTHQDSKLEFRSSEGAVRGCGKESFVLAAQGNKLVGTMGTMQIEFKKE